MQRNKQFYCEILDIDSNASLAEITRAYRIQAKILHPDVNPNPHANQQFILLNEAFEFLKKTHLANNKNTDEIFWQQWQQEKIKANQRAQQQAQMRYESYIQSDEYRYLNEINIIVDHIGIALTILFPIGLPLLFYFYFGKSGLLPTAIILIFFGLYAAEGLLLIKKFSLKNLYIAIKFAFRFNDFQLILLSLLNVFCFWNFCLPTMISMTYTSIFFVFAEIICWLLWRFAFPIKLKMSMLLIGIAPMIFNLLFVINYFWSEPSQHEIYHFKTGKYISEINLENDAYEHFTFIKFFPDPMKLGNHELIDYSFAKGIYGWKVMKKYELK